MKLELMNELLLKGRLGALLVLAALLFCVDAHAGEAADARLHVIARASEPSTWSGSRPRLEKVRLRRAARWAVEVRPGAELRLRVPDGATALAFSIGARANPDGRLGTRFRVQQAALGKRERLFEKTVRGDERGWHDFEASLGPTAANTKDRFIVLSVDRARLMEAPERNDKDTNEGPAKGKANRVRGWYGSILFLGPEPPSPVSLVGGRERPNVIVISLDTLGAAYVGDNDPEFDLTPSLEEFASQGFALDRAIAPYPATLASHSSLFSGLQPRHHGRYKGAQGAFASQVGALARSGFFTAAITENAYVGSTHGFSQGFDWYDDGVGEGFRAVSGNAAQTLGNARKWLARHGRARRFFLFIHTYEVHSPYVPKNRAARAKFKEIDPGIRKMLSANEMSKRIIDHNIGVHKLTDEEISWLEALHRTEVFSLDRIFGRFMRHLAAMGLANDTLVIVTSDHGELFGEHGRVGHGISLHNKAVHVPLAFRWPGVVVQGSSAAPVELVDVMPTVLELVGEPIPKGLDGRSLAPLILGKGPVEARPAFSELMYDPKACRYKERLSCRVDRYSVQTGRFKMVISKKPAYQRLFDLEADPREIKDVSVQYPEEVARHRALLDAYVAEQVDPNASEESAKKQGVAVDAETERLLEALGYIE